MIPDTIHYPSTFKKSPPAGFDGIFDWSWTEGCFGNPKITPMDLDAVVERRGNFVLFETKNPGVPIPQGQQITLNSFYNLGVFTIIFIEGKENPEKVQLWSAKGFHDTDPVANPIMGEHKSCTIYDLRDYLKRWTAFADANPA